MEKQAWPGGDNYFKNLESLGIKHFSRKDFGPSSRAGITQQKFPLSVLSLVFLEMLRLKTFVGGARRFLHHCAPSGVAY